MKLCNWRAEPCVEGLLVQRGAFHQVDQAKVVAQSRLESKRPNLHWLLLYARINCYEQNASPDNQVLLAEDGYVAAVDRTTDLNQEAVSLALRRAFQRCDHQILAASRAEDNWKGGTTACVALTIDKVSPQLCVAEQHDARSLKH